MFLCDRLITVGSGVQVSFPVFCCYVLILLVVGSISYCYCYCELSIVDKKWVETNNVFSYTSLLTNNDLLMTSELENMICLIDSPVN